MSKSIGQAAAMMRQIYAERSAPYVGIYFTAEVFAYMLSDGHSLLNRMDTKTFLDLSYELAHVEEVAETEDYEEAELVEIDYDEVILTIYRLPTDGYAIVHKNNSRSGDLQNVTAEVVDAVEETLDCKE